jgi:hypothetical protein
VVAEFLFESLRNSTKPRSVSALIFKRVDAGMFNCELTRDRVYVGGIPIVDVRPRFNL